MDEQSSSDRYAGHTDRAAMLKLARHDASPTVIRTSLWELAVPSRKFVFRVAAETVFPAGIIIDMVKVLAIQGATE